jgi:hypothetical protein
MRILGYVLGAVMIIVGALILGGYFELRFADPNSGRLLRTMFGIVLMLYGVYRIVAGRMAERRRDRENHINGEP